MNQKYCFGIDIGGTDIKIGLFIEEYGVFKIVKKLKIHTPKYHGGTDIPEFLVKNINSILAKNNISKQKISSIGIAMPGAVQKDGEVFRALNIGWKENNPIAILKYEYPGVTIKAGNDANLAALGENYFGAGKHCGNLIMITLGTGIGCGIIANGKIVTGAHGAAGEIGHICVNENEKSLCVCGKKGCLEQYASANGLARFYQSIDSAALREAENNQPSLTKFIIDSASRGDEKTQRAVMQMCNYLGKIMGTLAAVVDPQMFIIGGGISNAGGFLIDNIRKYYSQYCIEETKTVEVKLAELGNDAGMYGAVALALDL